MVGVHCNHRNSQAAQRLEFLLRRWNIAQLRAWLLARQVVAAAPSWHARVVGARAQLTDCSRVCIRPVHLTARARAGLQGMWGWGGGNKKLAGSPRPGDCCTDKYWEGTRRPSVPHPCIACLLQNASFWQPGLLRLIRAPLSPEAEVGAAFGRQPVGDQQHVAARGLFQLESARVGANHTPGCVPRVR